MNNVTSKCICGSEKRITDCCERYISGEKLPLDPESLMRSRYTAYANANIAYIAATMRGPALVGFDPQSALQWTQQIKWLRLQVVHAIAVGSDENSGYVEFIAHYLQQGQKQTLHEVSQFERIDGRWYYVDGVVKPMDKVCKK